MTAYKENKCLKRNGLPLAMILHRALVAAALSALALLPSCAGGRPARPRVQGDQYLVQQSELADTKQQNLYDAIRQVRPFWLTRDQRRGTTGGTEIIVYLDEQQIGGIGQLTRLPVSNAQRVRYMSATEAQVRFGARNGLRPAILVESVKQ